jgi:hypothetical protein
VTDRPSIPDLLRDWARGPISVEDADVDDARRARIVSGIARGIREAKVEGDRKRGKARIAIVLVAAAALAVLVGGLWRGLPPSAEVVARLIPSSTGVLVIRGAESRVPLPNAEQPLSGGDVVTTVVDASASMRLASGAEVNIGPSTRVALARAQTGDEQIDLSIGEVGLRIPPLGAGGSFRVQTPDARVVVHGTAFVVRVSQRVSSPGTITEVRVSEGKVSVEHQGSQLDLLPGQSWSSKETLAAESVPAVVAPAAPAPAAPAVQTAEATLPPLAAKPTKTAKNDPSALAEQNRLFAAASAARRRGDDRAALGQWNQLLLRYPESPLAPEARVERFRALKRLGRDVEAAREARRYLLDHQSGAARDEARGVALDPK